MRELSGNFTRLAGSGDHDNYKVDLQSQFKHLTLLPWLVLVPEVSQYRLNW
jgi:hypothetical protein